MLAEGIGVDYIRSDNGFNGFWYIHGYDTGMSINSNYSGGPFYGIEITGCKKGIVLSKLNQVPACFSRCVFEGSEASLVLDELTGAAQFYDCQFRSETRTVKPGPPAGYTASQVSFQNCVFEAPAHLTGLMSSVANSSFPFSGGDHIILDSDCRNVLLMDNTYQGGRSVQNNMSDKDDAKIRDTTKVYPVAKGFEYEPFISHAPSRDALYIATDFTGVVEGDADDDGPGIQLALDKAAAEGGGIVYLPAGEYYLKTSITVPGNVELRGALDIPHHGKLLWDKNQAHEFGTLIYVDHNRGSSSGSTIIISANAGIRGISVYYPNQDIHITGNARPYPWLFGLSGENIYVKNVCAVNPYQLMDIASARCDSHYIENIYAYTLVGGIRVGKGSTGGRIRNIHYNNTMLGQAYFPNDDDKLDSWCLKNMELFRLGHVVDQEMLLCFGRQCRAGFVLENESGKGADGLSIGFGVEDIEVGACIEVTGNSGFEFINASLLANNNTINFNSPDTLMLFNSRTKNSRHFLKSSGQIGRLVFTQVLHRGDNTSIQFDKGEVEILNGLFYNSLKIDLGSPDIPLRMYGIFLRKGLFEMNLNEPEVFWDYIPDLHAADPGIKFNPDLFLFPGDIKITGIQDSKHDAFMRVRIFPNPAKEVLYIERDQGGDLQLRIYDMLGRMVYSGMMQGNKMSLQANSIGPAGIYIAKFEGENWVEERLLNLR
ncbi:MAG TPA: T9SS type A sorting domain-containing protein [Bacteroides sp.]|nr:T9SS type A sorting domain-containing protein [Bacteroides sp.]